MSRTILISSALVAGLAFAAAPALAQSTLPQGGPVHAGSGTPGVNTNSTAGNPMDNGTDQTGTIPPVDQQQGGPAPHAGSGTPGVNK
jgi:hypothetical protein